MTATQRYQYRAQLLAPEHEPWLVLTLRTLPPGWLKGHFGQYFRSRKNPIDGLRLLGREVTRLTDLRDEQIISALATIRASEPTWLEAVVDHWCTLHEALFDAEDIVAVASTPQAAAIVLFLRDDAADKAQLLALLAVSLQQGLSLEHERQQATALNAKLERERDAAVARFQQQEHQAAEQLEREASKREMAATARLNKAIAALEREHESQLLAARQVQQHLASELERGRAELEFFKTQLDTATDALEAASTARPAEVEQLRSTIQRLNADLFEQGQALAESEQVRSDLRGRLTALDEQLAAERAVQHRLAAQAAALARKQQATVGGVQLEQALVFDYRGFSYHPVERLQGLFAAYRALLERQYAAPALVAHSNIADFADPEREVRGVLVLGMEQLLLDGVNSALEKLLDLRVYRQESLLKQLLGALSSARLGGSA